MLDFNELSKVDPELYASMGFDLQPLFSLRSINPLAAITIDIRK